MSPTLRTISKEELIEAFREIYSRGWIENKRGANDGAVGNTLEDLLHIPENNLPIPNAAEWELKAQRAATGSLLTLFHMEPSPRGLRIVPNVLLPKYGWASAGAGTKYPIDEMSFRGTFNALTYTDRGFKVNVNDVARKVEIMFNSEETDPCHKDWLEAVKQRTGHINDFDIRPYWGFDDLFHKAGTKLLNCFYVRAEVKKERTGNKTKEYFLYNYVLKLSRFNQDKLIEAFRKGLLYIDFDARTRHNHGTKVRIRYNDIPFLYSEAEVVLDKRNI